MLWSNVAKIREILGKDAILTKTAEIDGAPCFIIALPRERWQLVGKTPLPNELLIIEQETQEPGSVGNSDEPEAGALAIGENVSSVGNSPAVPLAMAEKEEG